MLRKRDNIQCISSVDNPNPICQSKCTSKFGGKELEAESSDTTQM